MCIYVYNIYIQKAFYIYISSLVVAIPQYPGSWKFDPLVWNMRQYAKNTYGKRKASILLDGWETLSSSSAPIQIGNICWEYG